MSEEKKLKALENGDIFEIDCLIVDKVYDACSTRVCENFDFDPEEADEAIGEFGVISPEQIDEIVDCEAVDEPAEFFDTSITPRPNTPIAIVEASFRCLVDITVRRVTGGTVVLRRAVEFENIRVLLFAPRPLRMKVVGEALCRCLGCTVEDKEFVIRCAVGAFVILKVAATVQLEVPVLGFCPVPEECEVLPEEEELCEIFEDENRTPFPDAEEFFPPQELFTAAKNQK